MPALGSESTARHLRPKAQQFGTPALTTGSDPAVDGEHAAAHSRAGRRQDHSLTMRPGPMPGDVSFEAPVPAHHMILTSPLILGTLQPREPARFGRGAPGLAEPVALAVAALVVRVRHGRQAGIAPRPPRRFEFVLSYFFERLVYLDVSLQ